MRHGSYKTVSKLECQRAISNRSVEECVCLEVGDSTLVPYIHPCSHILVYIMLQFICERYALAIATASLVVAYFCVQRIHTSVRIGKTIYVTHFVHTCLYICEKKTSNKKKQQKKDRKSYNKWCEIVLAMRCDVDQICSRSGHGVLARVHRSYVRVVFMHRKNRR